VASLLCGGRRKVALIVLILLALSLASTVAMQPGDRSPDSGSPIGYTGLRPDWVRVPPFHLTQTPSPVAIQPDPATPTMLPLSTPTPVEPPPTAEAPPPTETIGIAGVLVPIEAPPSPAAPPVESPPLPAESPSPPVENPPPPTETPSPPAPVVTEGLDLAFAAAIVELTNQARLANGLTPLTEHPALVAAAQKYADLHAHVSSDRLDHNLNGSTLASRIEAEGYTGWAFLAENLVWVSADPPLSPAETVQQWLNSSAHRSNMLNSTVNEIGVGCYLSSAQQPFRICVQDFGARP
jgi:uncharacterized protein YkwD